MASRLDATNKDVRVLQDDGGKPNTRKSTPKTSHYNLPTYTPLPPPPRIGSSTSLHSAMCEPLLKLFKMHFALFTGTSKQTSLQSSVSRVSVIDLWQCISRQLFRRSCFMVPIRWFLRFTSETEYVDNFCTAPTIFSAPKRGVLCPPKVLFVEAM